MRVKNGLRIRGISVESERELLHLSGGHQQNDLPAVDNAAPGHTSSGGKSVSHLIWLFALPAS